MFNNFTNINKMNSNLSPCITEHKKRPWYMTSPILILCILICLAHHLCGRGRRYHDSMVVGFITTTRGSQEPVIAHLFLIWHLKLIENGGVTHNFESGPPKDHFNLNFWATDFDVISALLHIKMNWNFNCSYMAISSLTYIMGFSVRFIQPVYSV
jgi:hypothetical protein